MIQFGVGDSTEGFEPCSAGSTVETSYGSWNLCQIQVQVWFLGRSQIAMVIILCGQDMLRLQEPSTQDVRDYGEVSTDTSGIDWASRLQCQVQNSRYHPSIFVFVCMCDFSARILLFQGSRVSLPQICTDFWQGEIQEIDVPAEAPQVVDKDPNNTGQRVSITAVYVSKTW